MAAISRTGGQGRSAATGLPTTWGPEENIVWKTALPGAGTSSPVVFEDRIYLTCYTGGGRGRGLDSLELHLVALSSDGKLLWQADIAPKLPEQESIREDHGYASGTPAVDDERIYVSFGKSGVFAFDHGGRQLWQASLGDRVHNWGSASSPVLFEDLVLVNASVESESLYVFDRRTGAVKWQARGIRDAWNTPILVQTAEGKTELAIAIFRKLLGFDPRTGEQLWSCDTEIDWYMAPSLVAHNDVIYSVGGRTGGSLAVRAGGRGDVTRTHRLWTSRKGSNVTSPLYHDGHLYWMHEQLGVAYCVNAATGELVYEQRAPDCGQVYASPVLADGKIYQLARNGRMFVFPAAPRYEILAVNTVGERGVFNASVAVAHSRIYLRSNTALYCIGRQ